MIRSIYCIRDALTGYLSPFISVNDDVAKRDFLLACKSGQIPAGVADDYSLDYLGEFNDADGMFYQPVKPRQICRGVNADDNVSDTV